MPGKNAYLNFKFLDKTKRSQQIQADLAALEDPRLSAASFSQKIEEIKKKQIEDSKADIDDLLRNKTSLSTVRDQKNDLEQYRGIFAKVPPKNEESDIEEIVAEPIEARPTKNASLSGWLRWCCCWQEPAIEPEEKKALLSKPSPMTMSKR